MDGQYVNSVTETTAFWGTELKPGEQEPIKLEDGEILRISMITLGPQIKDPSSRSVVTVRIGDDKEKEPPQNFSICVLQPGKNESQHVPLLFVGKETLHFRVTGKNSVCITGNFRFDLEFVSDDEDSEDDEDDDSEEGDEELLLEMGMRKIEEDPPRIEEVEEEVVGGKGKQKKGKKGQRADGDVVMKENEDEGKKVVGGKRAREDSEVDGHTAKKGKSAGANMNGSGAAAAAPTEGTGKKKKKRKRGKRKGGKQQSG